MLIACDESSSDHFLIGSVWIPKERLAEFEAEIHNLRLSMKYWREVHCVNLKRAGHAADFYEAFLRAGLEIPEVRFSFIVVKRDKEAEEQYHDGSHLKRNLVFLYELISRRYMAWGVKTDPYVIFDDMTSEDEEEEEEKPPREEIPEARKFIEKYIGKKLECFSPCRSHISSVVQLADLTAGLVAHKWKVVNEGGTVNVTKMSLVEHFEAFGDVNLSGSTGRLTHPVNIWKHTPKTL